MNKLVHELSSPLTRWRKTIGGKISEPFGRVPKVYKFWFGFALLALLTTVLIYNPLWRSNSDLVYREGEVARESIISPADIYFVDEDETERLRQQERSTVKPIFSAEPGRADEAAQTFRSAWEDLQRRLAGSNVQTNSNSRSDVQWTGAGGPELGKVFASRTFTANELDAVLRVLRENAGGDIYSDQDRPFLENEVAIFDRQKPTDSRQALRPTLTMTQLSDARRKLRDGLAQIRSLSERELAAFEAALAPLIQPSVLYDSAATENARNARAIAVTPVAISLKRTQKIADEGDVVTPRMMSQIAAIRKYSSSTRQLNRFLGLLVLISTLYWVAWKFIQHRGIAPRLALSPARTFALFGFIVVTQTLIVSAFFRLAEFTASQNVRAPLTDAGIWAFAIPFAFGSLLMTLLADRRTALFTGIFNAWIGGLLAPRGLEFALFAVALSSVAVYGIGRYRSRQTVTLAGALVSLSGAGLAVALIAYTQQPFILNTLLLAVACGLAGGIITAAVTAVFLPICENLFGILTDVKLLELSNADLPALGQLALRAPGTNQHSHAVGQLAEEACRAVGGNALLTRIGALYHDIGKTAAPEHFVENQSGKNPHDRLKPTQSAKIIISHVTYGVKLAREIGLPQRIIDFIPQHHGTRTLHYFLKKAQAESRSDTDVSENDFRYPGPKPQFREAAIMMIADSCEAAARSLAQPTPENIRFIVTKIVDAIVADDQLDECDLTLRELTQIREAMIRSLVAIYHSRVEYPGYVPPVSGEFKVDAKPPEAEYGGIKYADPADIPVSRGGEIEDEAFEHSEEPGKSRAEIGS